MLLYVDPGSGTLMWELIISFFVGTFFYFSKLNKWIVSRFHRRGARRAVTRKPLGENEILLGVTQAEPRQSRND